MAEVRGVTQSGGAMRQLLSDGDYSSEFDATAATTADYNQRPAAAAAAGTRLHPAASQHHCHT